MISKVIKCLEKSNTQCTENIRKQIEYRKPWNRKHG